MFCVILYNYRTSRPMGWRSCIVFGVTGVSSLPGEQPFWQVYSCLSSDPPAKFWAPVSECSSAPFPCCRIESSVSYGNCLLWNYFSIFFEWLEYLSRCPVIRSKIKPVSLQIRTRSRDVLWRLLRNFEIHCWEFFQIIQYNIPYRQ